MRSKYLYLFLFLVPFASLSQVTEQSGWLATFNSIKLNKNWGLHFDMQLRSADDLEYAKNLIVRPGLTYFISSKQNATAGYAFIQTYANPDLIGASDKTEHRIWQQYIRSYKIKNVPISHRFRLEQRFIEAPGTDIFSQRIRYFFRAVIPLKTPAGPFTKGLFAGLQNEVFLNLQNKKALNNQVFDQNRFYPSLGYRLSKKADIEVGYLNQYINGAKVDVTNHVAQLAVYSRF